MNGIRCRKRCHIYIYTHTHDADVLLHMLHITASLMFGTRGVASVAISGQFKVDKRGPPLAVRDI